MCDVCQEQFAEMTTHFDDMLRDYQADHGSGQLRHTPGERVHDLAFGYKQQCGLPRGYDMLSWCLAIALERLADIQA